jgi:site-specific DNA-methyltransferase (adenine-specific)
MEIYYEDETATVYHNKMEDIIDKLKFDYIFTDPPYNIGYDYKDYKDKMSDEDYINLFTHFQSHKTIIIHYPEAIVNYVCEGIGRVSKMMSWCYASNSTFKAHRSIAFFNCNPDFNKVRQPYKDPYDKRNIRLMEKQKKLNQPVGCRSYDWFSDIELIKNRNREKCKDFTNQIPIQLLERILIMTTEENDIILDPFFGSGSLYFACKKTNRKCIGIEQSINHLGCFSQRLNQLKDIGDTKEENDE